MSAALLEVSRYRKTVVTLRVAAAGAAAFVLSSVLTAAAALPAADPVSPTDPTTPAPPTAPVVGGIINVGINGPDGAPASSVLVLLGITVLSVAPAILLMMTSFTKIFIVLAMTRNAIGLTTIPPTQVLAGLAFFLSIFIMWPVLAQMNTAALQPYLAGHMSFVDAISAASGPLRTFMLAHTRQEDLGLMTRAANLANPASPDVVPMQTLIPAFMISELRAGFIIGFVIFIPLVVIDLVVSAGLMAMGMMMLPPVMISLPFKILLFIMVDGWGLIITSLIGSYRSG